MSAQGPASMDPVCVLAPAGCHQPGYCLLHSTLQPRPEQRPGHQLGHLDALIISSKYLHQPASEGKRSSSYTWQEGWGHSSWVPVYMCSYI